LRGFFVYMPRCSFIICLTLIVLNFKAQNYFVFNTDTINRTDIEGKKHGKWILFGKAKPNTCYMEDQKIEEGVYKANKKVGIWVEYYCNGNLKNKLNFFNGRPEGYVIMYFENGKISEEGDWKVNRWAGKYKTYDSLGTLLCDFVFDVKGKKQPGSWQINEKEHGDRFHISWCHKLTAADSLPDTLNGFYSLHNKKKRISKEGVFLKNKLINGKIYIYDEQGVLKSIRLYENGIFISDGLSVTKYFVPTVYAFEKTNSKMILNGWHTLYNKNKQITKDGKFVHNVFSDGNVYCYDKNSFLIRMLIYKNGKYDGEYPNSF